MGKFFYNLGVEISSNDNLEVTKSFEKYSLGLFISCGQYSVKQCLFIYFGPARSSPLCDFSVVPKRGGPLCSCGVQAAHCGGLSCCRGQALRQAHFSRCCSWAR